MTSLPLVVAVLYLVSCVLAFGWMRPYYRALNGTYSHVSDCGSIVSTGSPTERAVVASLFGPLSLALAIGQTRHHGFGWSLR